MHVCSTFERTIDRDIGLLSCEWIKSIDSFHVPRCAVHPFRRKSAVVTVAFHSELWFVMFFIMLRRHIVVVMIISFTSFALNFNSRKYVSEVSWLIPFSRRKLWNAFISNSDAFSTGTRFKVQNVIFYISAIISFSACGDLFFEFRSGSIEMPLDFSHWGRK